jgi:hypothetical protein
MLSVFHSSLRFSIAVNVGRRPEDGLTFDANQLTLCANHWGGEMQGAVIREIGRRRFSGP